MRKSIQKHLTDVNGLISGKTPIVSALIGDGSQGVVAANIGTDIDGVGYWRVLDGDISNHLAPPDWSLIT